MNRVEREIANTNREANARHDRERIHKPCADNNLPAFWKERGQNWQDPAWIRAHKAVVTRWRREGEVKTNYSTPQGFDVFCKQVANLRIPK